MIEVIEKCLINKNKKAAWEGAIKKMIPSYGVDLVKNPSLFKKIRSHNQKILGI
jgi:malate dehydrogenase (quinone)